MSDLSVANFDLVEEREFFAPAASDLIDGLIGQYQAMRARIERIAEMVNGETSQAMEYFFDGNRDPNSGRGDFSVARIFRKEGAIFALNSAYWSKALALTDVLDCMPQKRRDYWHAQLQGKKNFGNGYDAETIPPLPDFEDSTVRATLNDLLAMRAKFFAERVDGIFRGLSGDHVTNVPEGFGKRMIMGWMLSYGRINDSKAGLINDLRCVIAKFMGRDEPKYRASSIALQQMYNRTGEWNTLDAGALRVRVYKKGTAHLEVHPNIAYRLNQVLAGLYPLAIPPEFRAKPKKPSKEFVMMGRPLPFAVLELLATEQRYHGSATTFGFEYSAERNSVAFNEACQVLANIGGVLNKDGKFEFDYPYQSVVNEIVVTGCIPDTKAHQFYPTPESVARTAVEMAQICEFDRVLEPSAGQGDLAAFLSGEITCVEISPLHCAILKARGFNTVQADFLEWAATAPQFERVVLNPPFSEGRWKAHIEVAAQLVKPSGRLVAILPASAKGKDLLPGWSVEWSRLFDNEFAGTSVSVVILCGVRP